MCVYACARLRICAFLGGPPPPEVPLLFQSVNDRAVIAESRCKSTENKNAPPGI